MRYAGIIKNDLAAAPGVCLTLFVQGCHFHCLGCHNEDSWDFNGGVPFTNKTIDNIIKSLKANGINRTFCIMGGEPLAPENRSGVLDVIHSVKREYPNKLIWLWTGYQMDVLLKNLDVEPYIQEILDNTDVVIDGRFEKDLRDITLKYRGSSNQNIWRKIDNVWIKGDN